MMAANTGVNTPAARGPWPLGLTILLAALVVADIVSALESSMVYSAFKAIVAETGDPALSGWLVSAYFIVAGPAALVASRLGDMYGRKQVLIATLILVLLGSLISAVSPNFVGMIIGRGFQGLSGAIMPLCIGIYRVHAPPRFLSVGLGVLLSAHAIGTLIGLLVGGLIVDFAAWRYIFHAGAVGAVLALASVVFFIPMSARRAAGRLDWLGFGLIPPLTAGLFLISTIGKSQLSGGQTFMIAATSLLVLAAWAWHELRHPNPLLDLRALGKRNVALANLIAVMVSVGPTQMGLYFALLFQQPIWTGIGFGLAASMAGALKAPSSLFAAAAGPFAGYSADRWGPKSVLIAGCALQLLGWVVVLFGHQQFWMIFGAVFLCSGGAMTTNVGLTGIVARAAPSEKTSEAVGVFTVAKNIGNAIGAQLVGLLLGLSVISSASGGESYPDQTGHLATVGMFAGLSLAAMLVAFVFPSRLQEPQSSTTPKLVL